MSTGPGTGSEKVPAAGGGQHPACPPAAGGQDAGAAPPRPAAAEAAQGLRGADGAAATGRGARDLPPARECGRNGHGAEPIVSRGVRLQPNAEEFSVSDVEIATYGSILISNPLYSGDSQTATSQQVGTITAFG